jgi:hypothetical protein
MYLTISVEDILNYGCLCNLKGSSKELRKGLGRALDAFDSACQQWQQCHTCTQMDDMDCPDPLFVNYETGFSLAGVVSLGYRYSKKNFKLKIIDKILLEPPRTQHLF